MAGFKRPDLGPLKQFGREAYAWRQPSERSKTKWNNWLLKCNPSEYSKSGKKYNSHALLPRTEKLFYVSWSDESRLHTLYNPLTSRITQTDQVMVGDKMYFEIPHIPREIWPIIDIGPSDKALIMIETDNALRQPQPKGADTSKYTPSSVAPGSYKEIKSFRDKEKWYEAYDTEIKNLLQAMKPVIRTSAKTPILKTKTIFKYVWNTDGTLKKRKVRITARGGLAKPGVHFSEREISSPTLSYKSFRLLLAEITQQKFTAYTMDAVAAFLQARSNTPVWIEAPDDSMKAFEGCTEHTHCFKVHNSLYGLCQAGHDWYFTLKKELIANKWDQCPLDPCIWRICEHETVIAIMGVYVDDLIIGCHPKVLTRITNPIKEKLAFGETSLATSWTGLRIKHISGGYEVDMDAYLRNILHRFGMTDCKEAHEPLPTSFEYKVPTEKEIEEAREYPYMQVLGSIMFAQLCLYPELSYAVSTLATFGGGWSNAHWKAMQHCLRYTKTLIGQPRKFIYNEFGKLSIVTQVDASHGSTFDHHQRSRTGWLIYIHGNLTNWASKLQSNKTATSSTEAEILAAHDAVEEASWNLDVITFLRKQKGPIIKVYSDSQSAIKGARNNMLTKRNRSYKAKLHDLAEKIQKGLIKLHHSPTAILPADSLTKANGRVKHQQHFDATRKLQQWERELKRPQGPEEEGSQNTQIVKKARYL